MKISLVSDLHLEFDYQTLPGGDVLILAGDICEARSYHKQFHSTRLVDANAGTYRYVDFFEKECAKYDKVFYVMGNHEHYHGRLDKTYNLIKGMLPANVSLLENQVEEYGGVMFMGATLWTDLNKGDPITGWTLKSSMNDYRVIQNFYKDKSLYYKLTCDFTKDLHVETRNFFKKTLEEHADKPFVVITHHGPSHGSINEKYKHDYHMNGGYVSDLSGLILDHPNIKYWVHGHVHDPVDYTIGETRVVCNPRGYVPFEDTSQFRDSLILEIDT